MTIHRMIIGVTAVVLLVGCQAARPSISLEDAQQLATEFRAEGFTPPVRTIAGYRAGLSDLLGQFDSDCDLDRQYRVQRLQSFANAATSGSTSSKQRAAVGLLGIAEKEFAYGNFKDVINATKQAFSGLGAKGNQVRQAVMMTQLGRMQATSGDYSGASTSFFRASERWKGAGEGWVDKPQGRMMVHAANASIARMDGDLPAEEYFLREVLKLPVGNGGYYAMNEDEITARLSQNLVLQGRFVEAELAAKQMATIPPEEGSYDTFVFVNTVLSFGALADALYVQNRYDDAAYMARVTINRHYKQCSNPDGIPLVEAWRTLFKALGAQGKWDEIQDVLTILMRDMEPLSDRFEDLFAANPDILLARALGVTDGGADDNLIRDVDAALVAGLVTDDENAPVIMELKLIKAIALYRAGRADLAMNAFHGSMIAYLNNAYTQNGSTKAGGGEGRAEYFRQAYMEFLSSQQGRTAAQNIGVSAGHELFRIATLIPSGKVQKSFMASAARAAAKDPVLAGLVRQAQDLNEQILNAVDFLAFLETATLDQVDPKQLRSIRERIVLLNGAKETLDKETLDRFPDYADLMNPKAPSIDDFRDNLKPGEAALVIHTTTDQTYIWAIPKRGETAFAMIDIRRDGLADIVDDLRLALDPKNITSLLDIPDFDVVKAYGLYQLLLEPVQAGWKDARNLIVVAQGPLGLLPFSLLPTEPVSLPVSGVGNGLLFAKYRDIPWLARSHAVAILPSVSTLKALRSSSVTSVARRPFVGFGDPYFNVLQASLADQEALVQLAALSPQDGAEGLLRSVPQTRAVDSATLGLLPRLPDTRSEIMAIATALGADMKRDVFLGRDASEANAKSRDLSGYKVVSFATHGLVPGDLNGLTQPALALSSPLVTGDDNNDGLLTMGEVLGLKLNADWVVLSACNTAAGDGQGAEAISGLGRAFFYAGTRALLVSNWPVHSAATTELMTALFSIQNDNATVGRSEALRQTRTHMIDTAVYKNSDGSDAFSYAHPIFWAPFVIVGDGGTQ